jgi:hypothetical protein
VDRDVLGFPRGAQVGFIGHVMVGIKVTVAVTVGIRPWSRLGLGAGISSFEFASRVIGIRTRCWQSTMSSVVVDGGQRRGGVALSGAGR